jgi:hypothetical protein
MKTIVLLLALSSALQMQSQTTTAQPTGVQLTPNVQPPGLVLTNFNAAYANVSPKWMLQDEIYSAEYRDVNSNMGRVVSYDKLGNIVAIENELTNDAYPQPIGTYFVKKYPGEKYNTWSYEDGMGNKMYYILRGEQSIWFSSEGKFIPNTNGKKKTSRQIPYQDK